MSITLTSPESKLVEYSQAAVIKYNTMRHSRGGIDTLYAFVLSDNGRFSDGASYEPNLPAASICGERSALANMVLQESYAARVQSIVVADPIPRETVQSAVPCGTCRHLIWFHGTPETTVLLMPYIQTKIGWRFPRVEKYSINEFYPQPYEPVQGLWEGWTPE